MLSRSQLTTVLATILAIAVVNRVPAARQIVYGNGS